MDNFSEISMWTAKRSMAKRQKLIRKAVCGSMDRISCLPEETLLFILSLVSMEVAAKTSLLSHRWRNLWCFTPTLDFDGTSFLWKMASADAKIKMGYIYHFNHPDWRPVDEQRRKYVEWVDSVLAIHKAYNVDRFRLFFNLTRFHRQHIDKWLRHAVTKKARTLELDLTRDGTRSNFEHNHHLFGHYKFPCELLRDDGLVDDFRFLEKLCTHCVSVSGEAVEFFLRNCPRLEHVSISESGDLTSLKIIKLFPALKRLEICSCHYLDSLEIRDAGVVYLKYVGKKIRHFVLVNVPLLTQLCIEGMLVQSMADVLSYFKTHFPQLEMLKICCTYNSEHFSMEDTELFYSTAKLRCLKELVVKYPSRTNASWLPLANIVRAAPYLQRFVVEQFYRFPENFWEKEFEKIVGVYPHLKEFEFVGYSGATSEVHLIKQLLHGATSLEKIIVDPRLVFPDMCNLIIFHDMWKARALDDETKGRARADQQLPKIVPPGIVLEIR